MAEERLDFASASTVLVAKDGKFFFYEPGMGVIASDSSIEKAYEKFTIARQAYLTDLDRAGLSAVRLGTMQQSAARQPGAVRDLATFLAKFCIVLFVLGAIGLAGGVAASRALEQAASNISKTLAASGSVSLKDVAQKAADIAKDARDLPPEKKELLRRSIETISLEVEPFVDAWRNPSRSENPPTLPGGAQK